MDVAILGANSHIAKGLICNFLNQTSHTLHLFTRNPDLSSAFIATLGKKGDPDCEIISGYESFADKNYDLIINCVGAGPPAALNNNFSLWFTITEKYDNMVLDYLNTRPEALYINFSSGAIYGAGAAMPAAATTVNHFCPNNIPVEDYYSIVRLNSEAKHRSFPARRIIDLRIFGYFSRFININSGYFITELLGSVINRTVFKTNETNIVRDYIHPDDLFALICKCVEHEKINTAIDVISRKPVDKWRLIEYFKEKYRLEYEVDMSVNPTSPNKTGNVYCSEYNTYGKVGFTPLFSAFDAITMESEVLLTGRGINHG